MAHRLNTNKQFMIGNGILAFAVIFVVVIFVYMSLRFNSERKEQLQAVQHAELYEVELHGFAGSNTSVYVNDSLLLNHSSMPDSVITLRLHRFADENALLIVDNATEKLSLFELSEKGGKYRFERDEKGEVKQLAKE